MNKYLAVSFMLLAATVTATAATVQHHPFSQLFPPDTDLNLGGRDLANASEIETEVVRANDSDVFIRNSGNIDVARFLQGGDVKIPNGDLNVTGNITVRGRRLQQTATADPAITGSIDGSANRAEDVAVEGSYAFFADAAFRVFDISEPGNPRSVAVLDVAETSGARSIDYSGGYAYLTAPGSNRTTVIDVSNATDPQVIGSVKSGKLDNAQRIYVSGQHAYVAGDNPSTAFNGLVTIDVSDPSSPQIAGSLDLSGTADDVYVKGKYAYTDGGSNFYSIDVSDPANPELVDSAAIADEVWRIHVSGGYAYTGAWSSSEFSVVDISDPSNLNEVGSMTFGDAVSGVYADGKYAYIGLKDSTDALAVIDISDKSNPREIARVTDGTLLNQPWSVEISGRYAYVPTYHQNDNFLTVLELSGVDAPTADVGSLKAGELRVQNNLEVGNDIRAGSSLSVGRRGIRSEGGISTGGDLDMNKNQIRNIPSPSAPDAAVNKSYVDSSDDTVEDDQNLQDVLSQGNSAGSFDINMSNSNITDLGDVTVDGDTGITGGNIGVGTINPPSGSGFDAGRILEVSGAPSGKIGTLRVTGDTNKDARLQLFGDRKWVIQMDGDGSIGQEDAFSIYDGDAGSTRFTITTGGNVKVHDGDIQFSGNNGVLNAQSETVLGMDNADTHLYADGVNHLSLNDGGPVKVKNSDLDMNGNNITDSSRGNVSIGDSLRVYGNVWTTGADLAEVYRSSQSLEPGTVVSISRNRDDAVVRSPERFDNHVLGVVSGNPSYVMNMGENGYPIALRGKVEVKVSMENGEIERGDRIVPSSTPGVAMKCDIEPLDTLEEFEAYRDRAEHNRKCRDSTIGRALEKTDTRTRVLVEIGG